MDMESHLKKVNVNLQTEIQVKDKIIKSMASDLHRNGVTPSEDSKKYVDRIGCLEDIAKMVRENYLPGMLAAGMGKEIQAMFQVMDGNAG